MAFSTSAADATFGHILDHLPATVTIGGTDYTCNRVSLTARQIQGRDADFVQAYRFSLALQASDLTAPAPGSTVVFGAVTYRVIATDVSPDTLDLRIHLTDQYAP